MDASTAPPESPPGLTHMERAIIVRAIAAMRENDPDAAPTNAQMTQGHIALARAMEEARAAGSGSSVMHNFGAMQIVYEVLGQRSTRITVVRNSIAAPYASLPFQPISRLPGVQITDQRNGTYVFSIEITCFDAEALALLTASLDRAPPLVH